MKSKQKVNLILLVLGTMLVFSILSNPNFSNNQGRDDYSMEIRDKSLLKTANSEITIISPENKTYLEPMSGYYPATYGFENDDDGVIAKDWLGQAIVEPSYMGHNKVINHTTYGWTDTRVEFDNQTSGTIEFYFNINDTNKDVQFNCYGYDSVGASTRPIILGVHGGNFRRNDGSSWYALDIGTPCSVNTWYHLRIDFDCGTDTWNTSINGILKSWDDPYAQGDSEYISDLRFYQFLSPVITRFDAIGFSWDPNYIIGNNGQEGLLLGFENATTLEWMGYSLNGQINKTILGNTTIPFPDAGSHRIQVFGNDSLGNNYRSNIQYFTRNWDLTGSPILIDGDATGVGAHNWTWVEQQNWFGGGDGRQGNPYIIEYITINGQESSNCITIQDSSNYFIIRNCKVYNATNGIILFNTYNGTLTNNIINENSQSGIWLNICNNFTISENKAYDNLIGIYSMGSIDTSTITENVVNNNGFIGIYISGDCNDIDISGNTANENLGEGMRIEGNFNNSTILGNTANDNMFSGINLMFSIYTENIISGNTASNTITSNQAVGLNIAGNTGNNNTISGNTANDNIQYGISIQGGFNNNTISGNTAGNTITSNQDMGIYLLSNCNDNTISGNTANDNTQYGIYLLGNSNNNSISGNAANDNNLYGIRLGDNCDDNTITGNTANENTFVSQISYGIYLGNNCDNNTISGNAANDNDDYGIYLGDNCNNNNITGNTASNTIASNQDVGIYLLSICDNNIISGNTANDNTQYGIFLENNCDGNTISGNNASNTITSKQDIGIYLQTDCDGNIISGNNPKDNTQYGIYLENECDDNTISGNNASNTITSNQDMGIYLRGGSGGNIISGNNVNDNTQYGIYIENNCYGNNISGNKASNTITSNQDIGIYLLNGCGSSTISGNTANDNTQYGIYLENNCDSNTISGNNASNTIASNQDIGIYLLSDCDRNTISGNNVNDNTQYGIYIENNCYGNNISGNKASNTITSNQDIGIYLLNGCGSSTISGNTANDNTQYGIYLENNCNNNNISGNIANNNIQYGIYLVDCSNAKLSGNQMSGYGVGIIGSIAQISSHTIYSNNMVNGKPLYYYANRIGLDADNFTGAGQVILVKCHDSIISNLNISYTSYGLYLHSCVNNIISGNEFQNNSISGICITGSSDSNFILNNYIAFNGYNGLEFNGNITLINNIVWLNGGGDILKQIIPREGGNVILSIGNIIGHTFDTDGDGLSDYDELMIHGTNPLMIDTDLDNLNDAFELKYGTDPLDDDTDDDGYYDGIEVASGTDPKDPNDYPGSPSPPSPPPSPPSDDDDDDVDEKREEEPLLPLIVILGASIAAGVIIVIVAWKKGLLTKLNRK